MRRRLAPRFEARVGWSPMDHRLDLQFWKFHQDAQWIHLTEPEKRWRLQRKSAKMVPASQQASRGVRNERPAPQVAA